MRAPAAPVELIALALLATGCSYELRPSSGIVGTYELSDEDEDRTN